ncbi:MAG: glycosyltransferase family 39 protein [Campylobacteraceae bacterium]|nr:glycosyltransferase family 39 protein [Campylobacteraceae bacterium]
MREKILLFLMIAIDFILLIFASSTLSISYYEADIFFNANSAVHYLIKLSCELFGQNDYALRAPFIIIHLLCVVLLYLISKPLLKRKTDRLITVLIYMMLPGSIVVSLAANSAAFIVFGILLFVYLHQNGRIFSMCAVLALSLFFGKGFIILYLLLFFYAVFKRDTLIMILSLALFTAGAYIYGFDIGGRPRGYFLDTFGIYAAIFSPLLFLYFIYVQYRILVKGGKSLIWWLSFGAFLFSLILSFRQRIAVEEFASYTIIAAPLIVGTFMSSFRVRLPQYRKFHKFFALLIIFSLLFNTVLVLGNQYLYTFLHKNSSHFAYKYHIAKELSSELKTRGVTKIHTDDKKLALRLKFYGINDGGEFILERSSVGDIAVIYGDTVIEKYKLTYQ